MYYVKNLISRRISSSAYRHLLAALLFFGVLGIIALAVSDSQETSAVRRGDFPAFWSMAVIAAGTEPEKLYDLEEQQRVQNAAWPSLSGGVLPGDYPAHVAFLLQPLANLDHRVARVVWTGASIVAACIAVSLGVGVNRRIRWAPWMVFTLLCVFTPILRGILGGQVVAFVVCLIAIVATCERRNSLHTEVAMGVALGVLLLKPHYALGALVIPLLQRRWVCLVSFAGMALLSWQLGALVLGPGWISDWVLFSRHFAILYLESNAHQMPNVWAQVHRLRAAYSIGDGAGWSAILGAYGILGLTVVSMLGSAKLRMLFRHPRQHGGLILSLVLSLAVVALPHVNFYDLGVSAFAVLLLFRPEKPVDRLFVGLALLASFGGSEAFIGISLHFLFALAGLFYVCVRIRQSLVERDRSPELAGCIY